MAKQIKNNKFEFIKNFENFKEFCTLNDARKLRQEEFANKYVLGIKNLITEEYTKTEILKQIRRHHETELEDIIKVLTENILIIKNACGKNVVIKLLKYEDNFDASKEDNIIAVEIRIKNDCIDLVKNNYNYNYAISWSKNINPSNELKRILYNKLFTIENEMIKIDAEHYNLLDLMKIKTAVILKDNLLKQVLERLNLPNNNTKVKDTVEKILYDEDKHQADQNFVEVNQNAIQTYEINKILDLSKNLDHDLINQAVTIDDPEITLAGLISLDQ